MATNRFLIVGKYAVGSNRGLKDIDLVDTRVRGGGVKEDLIEDFKGSYPQVRWFHDIGHYDGTPFPGATAVLVDLPASLLEVNGGIFNKEQIDSIVKHHLSFGVYPVIRFYCTNTGLVKHEDVFDSTGAGTWDVPDNETCPDEDGTVLCTLVTTTTTIPFLYEMLNYFIDFDDDDHYLSSYDSELSYTALSVKFEDPVNGAEKLQVELRTQNALHTPRWWTNIGGITPDPGLGSSLEGVNVGGPFENVSSAKYTGGPWSAAELAGLNLFIEESSDSHSPLDLSGIRIHLYDASDVLLETVYPNEIWSGWSFSNHFRNPQLDIAPPGYQWVDRTIDSQWSIVGDFAWNAGGWWDITGTGASRLTVNGAWNENLRPLGIRITHDGAVQGNVRVWNGSTTHGQRWVMTSGVVIDLCELEDWGLDMLNVEWQTPPNGAKITKIETLDPI